MVFNEGPRGWLLRQHYCQQNCSAVPGSDTSDNRGDSLLRGVSLRSFIKGHCDIFEPSQNALPYIKQFGRQPKRRALLSEISKSNHCCCYPHPRMLHLMPAAGCLLSSPAWRLGLESWDRGLEVSMERQTVFGDAPGAP